MLEPTTWNESVETPWAEGAFALLATAEVEGENRVEGEFEGRAQFDETEVLDRRFATFAIGVGVLGLEAEATDPADELRPTPEAGKTIRVANLAAWSVGDERGWLRTVGSDRVEATTAGGIVGISGTRAVLGTTRASRASTAGRIRVLVLGIGDPP